MEPVETRPEPAPLSPKEEAEKVVQSYYDAVDSGFYRGAWELLSPTLQDEQGGYGTWKAGYATTVETKTSDVNATDVDACGAIVDQTFSGTWTLFGQRKRPAWKRLCRGKDRWRDPCARCERLWVGARRTRAGGM